MNLRALFAGLILLPLAGCLGGSEEAAPDVVATFYPLQFLAERIGGEQVHVAVMVGAGIEPHDWEPGIHDILRVGGARLVLSQGGGFEPWLDGVVEALGADAPRVVNTTQGIHLSPNRHDDQHDDHDDEHGHGHVTAHDDDGHDAHDHAHEHDDAHEQDDGHEHDDGHHDDENATGDHSGSTHESTGASAHAEEEGDHDDHAHGPVDPHTWLDPILFAQQARNVQAALSEAWPEHAALFAQRADALVADLEDLDLEFATTLSKSCETRVVIVNHGAFGYLGARYDIDFHAVSGLAPEAEPTARAMSEIIHLAREHHVKIIFFEELVNPRVAEVIADEVGAETRVLSPVEGLTPEASSRGADYIVLMREDLAHLAEAMRCPS